jgi:hypothetical protein
VDQRIESDVGGAASDLREGTDLRRRGVPYPAVQVQPVHALLDPLSLVGSAWGGDPLWRFVTSNHHPAIHASPPECERWQGDIAVLVIGELDGVERDRLLSHLDGCPHCRSLREELSETARALATLVRVRPGSSHDHPQSSGY